MNELTASERSGLIDRDRLRALRPVLQEQLAPIATYYSIDGKTFGFEAPISEALPVGGYVRLTTSAGDAYLGQVISKEVVVRDGPQLSLDVTQVADQTLLAAGLSGAVFRVRLRAVEGSGVLLGRETPQGITPTTGADTFNDAEATPADDQLISNYLTSFRNARTGLDIGYIAHSSGSARAMLRPAGFNRHTFLCGQSGSGKTFSLGVLLERILLETDLRIVILDPNSDFVRLRELHSLDDHNRLRRSPLSAEDFASVAARHAQVATNVRVLRPHPRAGDAEALRVQFSDLAAHEQSTVLQLDPLADRGEYSAFWRQVDSLGDGYTLRDVEQAALRDLSVDARQLALRISNLGASQWDVWCRPDERSVRQVLEDAWRAVVVDVGGFVRPAEQAVAALAVLDHLWRTRDERRPTLIVIDEAHNVCPQDAPDPLLALAAEHVIRIAGEGRKFGLYLLLATQRPAKVHANVLSQCDNLVLLRTNSSSDLEHVAALFSQAPQSLVSQAAHFRQGEALIAGGVVPAPLFAQIEGRFTPEGGSDIPTTWAH